MKKFLAFLSVLLASCLTVVSVDAATVTRRGTVNSNYLVQYSYRYNYSATIGYNSPGNGLIYSYSDISLSTPPHYGGYKATPRQYSKKLNSNKTAVIYVVSVDIEVLLGVGSYMYVGTQQDTITISSPGPSRSVGDLGLITNVEHGDFYFDPDVAKLYE